MRRFLIHFKGAKLVQAINRYEHALALLWYFQPTVEDWRKKGIQDENMELIDLRTKTPDPEVQQKITIMISQILTNIAVIKLKESKFSECVKCSSVSKKSFFIFFKFKYLTVLTYFIFSLKYL